MKVVRNQNQTPTLGETQFGEPKCGMLSIMTENLRLGNREREQKQTYYAGLNV